MYSPEILDVHTHTFSHTAIVQVNALKPLEIKPQFCTVSIHPWDADRITPLQAADILQTVIEKFHPVGVGETGIDRVAQVCINQQKVLWEIHLQQAEKRQIPVVIHSVRALSDLAMYIKKHPSITYIFHSYQGNEYQTHRLLNYKTYFSFGNALLGNNLNVDNLLSLIPLERILIESDNTGLPIDNFLTAISQKVGLPIEKIRSILIQNAKMAFNL